uniref:Telomerase RNA component interacting RNase n=1 Tax=Myripristis murdjan TaxID=586833 RepID=A0A667ZM34_9TELE
VNTNIDQTRVGGCSFLVVLSIIGSPRAGARVTVSVFYPLTQVGKRRGGVFLKTGMVAKKQKQDSEAEPGKSDAWSKYMAEVKKYKAHQCGDDDKTRPLVK